MMRWTKVRQLPAGVVLLLMVASVLATVVAFRPWGSGEIDEVSAAGEIVAKRDAGFLHVTSDALAPYFALTNQDGQPVSLDDYQGKWLVMDWVYTSCLTTCPALTANMKMLLDGLGEHAGPEVELVSITFDPDRDTPAVMKSYSEKVGGDVPEWAWLTGARQDTDAVADAYDKVYGPAIGIKNLGHFDHTALVVVIDPEGIERHRYFGTGWSQDLLTRLEPDLIAMRLDEEKIPQVSEIGDQTIAVEPEHTDSAPSERTPLVSALGTAESLRATAKEFKGETGDAFDDIDSEFVLQFKAEGAASSWLRAQVIEAVDAGWRVMEAEPPDGAGFEYTLLEGPDGTYLGVARELWMALEITGTNPSRVYAMLFYAQGLCCFFG